MLVLALAAICNGATRAGAAVAAGDALGAVRAAGPGAGALPAGPTVAQVPRPKPVAPQQGITVGGDAAPADGGGPPPAPDLTWKRIRGTATDLAISANGVVFSLDRHGRVWRWRGGAEGGWSLMPRRFRAIAADAKGKPLAIGRDDGIAYHYNGLWWEALGTRRLRDIAAGPDGRVVAASRDGHLLAWDPAKTRWSEHGGRDLVKVALDTVGRVVALDRAHRIWRFGAGKTRQLPGLASDIAIGPEGAVFAVTPDGALARRDIAAAQWVVEPGVASVAHVAVGPGGYPWVVDADGRILATATFGPDEHQGPGQPSNDLFAEDRARIRARLGAVVILPDVTDTSPLVFTRVPGKADRIAIGRDGSVVIRNTESRLFVFSAADEAFSPIPGRFSRISVDRTGAILGIDNARNVVRQAGAEQTVISDKVGASEIDVGPDGTLFVTDADARVLKFDATLGRFVDTGRIAFRIATDPKGNLWGIDLNGHLFRCDQLPCRVVPTPVLNDLDIGPDGSVFVVDTLDRLYRYGPSDDSLTFVRNRVARVAVGPRGRPWVIDSDRQVFATEFFRRDESADQTLAAKSLQTQGPSSPTITFTKHIRFQRVATQLDTGTDLGPTFDPPALEPELATGGDGTVAVLAQPIVTTSWPNVRWRYDPKRSYLAIDRPPPPFPAWPAPPDQGQRSFGVSRNGEYWYIFYDGATGQYTLYSPTPGGGLRQDATTLSPGSEYGIHMDLGGNDSLYVLSSDGEILSWVPQIRRLIVFDASRLYRWVATDPDGFVWATHGEGVVRFDGTKNSFVDVPWKGIPPTFIDVGPEGTVFVADEEGSLWRYNATNNNFDRVATRLIVTGLAVDGQGMPWILAISPSSGEQAIYRGTAQ